MCMVVMCLYVLWENWWCDIERLWVSVCELMNATHLDNVECSHLIPQISLPNKHLQQKVSTSVPSQLVCFGRYCSHGNCVGWRYYCDCVCMWMCMHVNVCACECVWMWMCMHVNVCGCECVWMWMCVDVNVYACMCLYVLWEHWWCDIERLWVSVCELMNATHLDNVECSHLIPQISLPNKHLQQKVSTSVPSQLVCFGRYCGHGNCVGWRYNTVDPHHSILVDILTIWRAYFVHCIMSLYHHVTLGSSWV